MRKTEPNNAALTADQREKIIMLVGRLDILIRQLWIVYSDMSDVMDAKKFDSIDLEIWALITKHRAVHSRLHCGDPAKWLRAWHEEGMGLPAIVANAIIAKAKGE
jgi:hypothetical protein